MDLLNYDSDDTSANTAEKTVEVSGCLKVASKVASKPRTMNLAAQPTNQPAKKRKIVDISFLPQHIQNALLHGDSTLDSDAEDEPTSKLSTSATNTRRNGIKGAGATVESVDPLLAMLPVPINPKHAKEAELYEFTKPKSANSLPRSTATKEPPAYQSSSSKYLAVDNDRDDVEDHAHGTSQFHAKQNQSTSSLSSHHYEVDNEEEDFDPNPELSSHAKSKRHQREVEQMLMAGDLSAIDTSAIPEISGQRNWNQMEYTDKMQREALIIKQYTQDGTIKSAMQPTKLQNRRHQLTSLAMKAAETEISMLDAQTARGRNKAQSKQKYGW